MHETLIAPAHVPAAWQLMRSSKQQQEQQQQAAAASSSSSKQQQHAHADDAHDDATTNDDEQTTTYIDSRRVTDSHSELYVFQGHSHSQQTNRVLVPLIHACD